MQRPIGAGYRRYPCDAVDPSALPDDNARDPNTKASVVAQRLKKSAAGAPATLIGMHGAERYSAGIVDCHMDELPAGAMGVLLAVTRDSVAGLAESSQLLDIQMQEVAGFRVFVAHHGRRRFQLGQAMQAGLSEAPRHRADGQAQVAGYLAIGLAGAPLLDEARKQSFRGGMRATFRPG